MLDCAPVSIPINTSPLLQNDSRYICPSNIKNKYQRIIGSLIYVILRTRGNITYAVSVASRHLTNPSPQYVKLAWRILRYLKDTKSLSLAYKGQLQILRGFTDADWANYRQTRRLIAGYLFNIRSGAISWQLKRQNIITLLTCKAKFIGQTQATKEAI